MYVHTYIYIHVCMYVLLYFWRALSEAACDSFLLHFSLVNYATARIVMANANTYINIYVCMNARHGELCGGYATHGNDNFICMYMHMYLCTYVYKKPTTKITQQTAHHRERNMEGVGKGEGNGAREHEQPAKTKV